MRCPLTWRCPLTGWTCRLPSWACYFSLWSAVAVSVCVLAVAVEVSRIEVGNLRSPVQLPWPSFTESPGALEARFGTIRVGLYIFFLTFAGLLFMGFAVATHLMPMKRSYRHVAAHVVPSGIVAVQFGTTMLCSVFTGRVELATGISNGARGPVIYWLMALFLALGITISLQPISRRAVGGFVGTLFGLRVVGAFAVYLRTELVESITVILPCTNVPLVLGTLLGLWLRGSCGGGATAAPCTAPAAAEGACKSVDAFAAAEVAFGTGTPPCGGRKQQQQQQQQQQPKPKPKVRVRWNTADVDAARRARHEQRAVGLNSLVQHTVQQMQQTAQQMRAGSDGGCGGGEDGDVEAGPAPAPAAPTWDGPPAPFAPFTPYAPFPPFPPVVPPPAAGAPPRAGAPPAGGAGAAAPPPPQRRRPTPLAALSLFYGMFF